MNKRRQAHFTLIELIVVIATVAILSAILLPSIRKSGDSAKQAQCMANCKTFAMANVLYGASFNGFVTPIAWGDGVNIWPALLWNMCSDNVAMPYKDFDSGKDKWLRIVKNSRMFECPADVSSELMADSASDMPKLSYAINRSAVRNMKSSANAARIPSGPVLKTTKFKIPSRMIYVCDTSWNRWPSFGSDAIGRLYSTRPHPSYDFKPGSICHHLDQSRLASEFNEGGSEMTPWHANKTWNYSFMDCHAEALRPEQTIKKGRSVSDHEPSGYWTWNQEPWGEDE